ncbi:hypothetical protein [Streptomyces sp. NPDC088812]|uniref:hypothetical protein n=1 Tax=Streptomyces sp. NPDC088812 TaxID=3365905 RepID=UPI003806AB75
MSSNGPSTPPDPPGPPLPDPDHHRLARRSVRWTIIGVVISTVLAVIGLYIDAERSDGADSGGTTSSGGHTGSGGTDSGGDADSGGDSGGDADSGEDTGPSDSPSPVDVTDGGGSDASGTSDAGGTSDSGGASGSGDTSGDSGSDGGSDGLTDAEHALRDSLNSDQWSRDSCTRTLWPGSDAALFCTVTTTDESGAAFTGKASVVAYATKSARDAVFQQYASRVQAGDCETQTNVYGSWSENDSPGEAAGDVVCYLATSGQYVFLCSYYDRPTLVQVTGPDQGSLVAWWHTMDRVFTG